MPPRQRKGKPAWRGFAICMNFISFARQVRKAERCKYISIYTYISEDPPGSKDQRAFTTGVWRADDQRASGKTKFKSGNAGGSRKLGSQVRPKGNRGRGFDPKRWNEISGLGFSP